MKDKIQIKGQIKSKLKSILTQKGINRKSLAEETGVLNSTVHELYKEYPTKLDLEAMLAICKYLGLEKISSMIEIETKAEVDSTSPKKKGSRTGT